MKNEPRPGKKAVTTAHDGDFATGKKPGTGTNPKTTESPRTRGKFQGSSTRPLNKGGRDKHFHAQPVTKIPRSSQMNSGT